MSKHTPTPWAAAQARTLIHITGSNSVCEISISANHVHEDYPGRKAEYIARQKANAAFIVLACNSHDALVEALTALRAECMGMVPACADQVDAALALVQS